MKLQSTLGYWGAAVLSIACAGGDGGAQSASMAGSSSASGGAGSGGMSPLGGAGTGGSTAGATTLPTPMAGSAGAVATAGQGGGGGEGGLGGAGGDSGGSSGSGGSGGSAGSVVGDFGVVSCQPAFETACKPNIVFTNGDPTGRGKVFTDVIPDIEATEKEIACTVCSILYRTPDEIPPDKHPTTINIVLDTHGGVAQAGGDTIQFDLDYIGSYAGETADVIEQEMKGVLQHETVHLYQNYGNTGTGEGLADLVRARTGYYPQSRWQSEGDWMTPYTASGNFYSWLTGPCSFHTESYSAHDLDFPYKMNKALENESDAAAFDAVSALIQTTFGKDVDTLWDEYQADAFGL